MCGVCMSYPCARCRVCRSRVQVAVHCVPGELPALACSDRDARFTALFEDDAAALSCCRGQGTRYSPWPHHNQTLHYNFSGAFTGLCCFCALKAGFSPSVFGQTACRQCVWRERLRAEVAVCFGSGAGATSVSWVSHGWRALPSAIVDRILVLVLGLDGRNADVLDGEVRVPRV